MSRLYFYQGLSLRQYCAENDVKYSRILARINDLKKINPDLPVAEIIKKAIEDYQDPRCRFTYQGMSLRQYCLTHDYNFQRIYRRIKDLTDINEINHRLAAYFADDPTKRIPRYKIAGLSLKKYCDLKGYIYPTLKTYIANIRETNPHLSDDEIVSAAIEHYKQHHEYKELWFYHGERLVDFCKRNNLSYANIFSYLDHMNIPNPQDISDEELNEAIKKYHLKVRKDAFAKLNNCQTEEEYQEIITLLNIDKASVDLVKTFNYSTIRAIYFVWYFGKEQNGKISLDIKRINTVLKCVGRIDLFEINFLLGYYYSGIYDTRQLIYNKIFLSIRKIVSDLSKIYHILPNSDYYQELKSEADLLAFEFIERTNSRYIGQIISYMNAYITGCLKRKILRDLKENDKLSLNSKIKFDSKKEFLDNLSDTSSMVDTSYFSDEMINIIKSLTSLEQKYIILRFQNLLDDDEIAEILKMPLEDVLILRDQALTKLKNNNQIQKLMLKRS